MHDPVMPQAQREILALLKTTALTMKEVGALRETPWASAMRSLAILVRDGYAVRYGYLPATKGSAAAFHWTGKAFPAPPMSPELSDRMCRALSFPHQLRRFTLAQELTTPRSKA